MVGLLRATALAVDGGGTGGFGQPGVQPCLSCDVPALLAELGDAATDDLLDLIRIQTGACDHRPLNAAEQLGGMQPREPSTAFADGAARRFDDDRITHGAAPLHSEC